jgi:acetyl-CoA C-acetyltransferase
VEEVVILAATRTATGKFGGSLAAFPAPKPGAIVVKDLLKRTGLKPEQIDEIILGQLLTAGSGQNPARQTGIKGEPVIFAVDEFPRHGTTVESLSNLPPAFSKDGTVTAGNASGINDGAAAVIVCSGTKARELGIAPMATSRGYASAGVAPASMGIGPVEAVHETLAKARWGVDELDQIESNEAFAAQSMAVTAELKWDTDRLNVNGGAIAPGHPIGASGARILVTLLHELGHSDLHKGLATLRVGGGQGVAVAVER